MKFNKLKIANMEKAYSVCPVIFNNERKFIVGTEKKGEINLFDEDGNLEECIIDGKGGVMSIVPLPNQNESFLSTYEFYSPNDGYNAKIVHFKKLNNKWEMNTIAELPFVHRFDILKSDDKYYLIACTIKSGFEFKNDWNNPGKVYVCELPNDLENYSIDNQLNFEIIADNLEKNHGYFKVKLENDDEYALVTAVEGVFKVCPPSLEKDSWTVKKILDQSTSDSLLYDIDLDGRKELVTISEFHGDHLDIYKEKEKDLFEKVYSYKKPLRFLHALYVGYVDEKPVLFIGHRGGERDLFALSYNGSTYERFDIDENVGVANISGYEIDGKLRLIAAHRETNQVCLYKLD